MSAKSMSDSRQAHEASNNFRLGPLGNLNQVIKALAKVIRAMANDSIGSEKGARIANALGIMRACLETKMLAEMEDKMDEAEETFGRAVSRQEGIRLQ